MITRDPVELALAAILALTVLGLLVWAWLSDANDRLSQDLAELEARHKFERAIEAGFLADTPKAWQ